jgi:drug/metabolite transporter (DMT)-like permease
MNIPNSTPLFGNALSIITGCLVALSYVVLKNVGFNEGGFVTFTWACLAVGIIHLCIHPNTWRAIFSSRAIIVRGLFFSITQFLICLALREGSASAALIAGTMGTIVGAMLGRFVLKEKVSRIQYIGLGIALLGSLADPTLYTFSSMAILGGVVQGSNITNTRYIMRDKLTPYPVVAGSFLISGLLGLILIFFISDNAINYTSTSYFGVGTLALIMTILHYFICFSLHYVDSQRSAAFGLIRIPAVLTIEYLIYSTLPTKYQGISFALITTGVLVILFFPKIGRDETTLQKNTQKL